MIAALHIVSGWLLGDNSIRGDAYRSFWESFEPRVRLGGSVITYPHFGAPLSPACRITFPRMHDPSSADSSVACAACAHQHPKSGRCSKRVPLDAPDGTAPALRFSSWRRAGTSFGDQRCLP